LPAFRPAGRIFVPESHDGENLGAELRRCREELAAAAAERRDSEERYRLLAQQIGDQRQAEAQLYLAERMRSVGTLAEGIAHDFNNILMGIQGHASLLLQRLGADSPHAEGVLNIEQCVESGAEFIRRILGFARGGVLQIAPTNLNGLVQGTARMFGRAKTQLAIHGAYQEDLPAAAVDRTQIEQVLLNLFLNAWQAMPGGGDLFLETRSLTLDEAQAGSLQVAPGRYVSVAVRDTGCGMAPEVLIRIFDPFFSTRTRGRGTGLGLASVYGIVRNHGGHIGVESTPGGGSTFTILLPASDLPVGPGGRPGPDGVAGAGI
jgi:signal transduction histidine kinase